MSRTKKVSTKAKHKLRIRNLSPNCIRNINNTPLYKVMLSISARVCTCVWCTDRRRHKFKYYLDHEHKTEIYQHVTGICAYDAYINQ